MTNIIECAETEVWEAWRDEWTTWRARLRDLETELTINEWAKVRMMLRFENAPHTAFTESVYELAEAAPSVAGGTPDRNAQGQPVLCSCGDWRCLHQLHLRTQEARFRALFFSEEDRHQAASSFDVSVPSDASRR